MAYIQYDTGNGSLSMIGNNLTSPACLKRKTDNNFLVKILSRFSATRLRSVLQLDPRGRVY